MQKLPNYEAREEEAHLFACGRLPKVLVSDVAVYMSRHAKRKHDGAREPRAIMPSPFAIPAVHQEASEDLETISSNTDVGSCPPSSKVTWFLLTV